MSDEAYMRMALALAEEAARLGEVPVGAVVVRDGEVGYVVPDGDEAALADRALRLLRDADLRRRMGEEARSWVTREFSIAALVRKTQAVYTDLLARRRRLRWS